MQVTFLDLATSAAQFSFPSYLIGNGLIKSHGVVAEHKMELPFICTFCLPLSLSYSFYQSLSWCFEFYYRPARLVGCSSYINLLSYICYAEDRYVCFARDEDRWLIYDSDTIESEDTWEHLLERFRDCKLQPEVLIFEVIKQICRIQTVVTIFYGWSLEHRRQALR